MTLNIPELTAVWQRLHNLAHEAIAPIVTENDYERALAALDDLLAQVGEDNQHPLGDLVEGLVGRVVAYQEAAQHIPPAAPDMELRLLIKENRITQQQLAAATGIGQGQISKLANGKRAFTTNHIRALSAHFEVSADRFLS